MNTSDGNVVRFFPASQPDDLSTYGHRQLIGYVGMLLPALLLLFAGWRPMEGLTPWKTLTSISAYFYTGAVPVFAGGLVALALFLFSYQGYDNEYGHRDRVAGRIAGVAALLVAIFPTAVPNPLLAPSWWTPLIGWIHYLSAVVLFGSFVFFSLIQFPKSELAKADLPLEKRVRNGIYVFCGWAIVACMLWAVAASLTNRSIFWPETLALEFFAMSWLTKGKADRTAGAVLRQTIHYGLHPQQFAGDVWNAVLGKPGAESEVSQDDAGN